MRKTSFILLTGLALSMAACQQDATAPADSTYLLEDAADMGYSASFVGDPSKNFLGNLYGRLPDNLKLSAAQEAQIKALVSAFETATKADHDALAAIQRAAKAAAAAGKTPAEVQAILDTGKAIRDRLAAAEAKLQADINAVLTAEQKAWLESHKPTPCTAPALTDAQKNQISALIAAFEAANKADLDAIKAATEKARDAAKNGATKEQVAAILATVKANMDRVHAAETALRASIDAVLTPEQRAANCGLPKVPQPPGPPSTGGHK